MSELPFGGPPAEPGVVYLVGAGPGDPGLMSLRGAKLLASATFVAYDRLAPPEALRLCADDCVLLYVGKRPDHHAMSQGDINSALVGKAKAGEAVVRLKGGDPFVLGRGSEEAQACVAAGLRFEIVPGVTAGTAVPAYAGIPVTHRGIAPAFAVVTGHEDPSKADSQVDYRALADFPGTLLLYMGVGRVREIAAALIAGGRAGDTAVALVRWGTTPRQETLVGTLADIAGRVEGAAFANPAVIVVGDVVKLRHDLEWFERRPMHGVRVLVPRTRHQASELSERLRVLGAEPIEAPTIAIEPTREPARLHTALGRVREGAYDWLALTSANGVQALFEGLALLGGDARWFAAVRLAAVGPGTAAALEARGLRSDLLPERYTTKGLAAALIAGGRGSVLLPRADIATPILREALTAAGWAVDEVEAYRTVRAAALPAGVAEDLRDGRIDVIAFASSSTVRYLLDLLGDDPVDGRVRVAAIGPVTAATCREHGLRVDAEAEPHDLDGLIAAVARAALARGPEAQYRTDRFGGTSSPSGGSNGFG